MAARCIAAVSLLAFGNADYAKIAGYEPGSDVVQHNRLDLDQKEMESHLGKTPADFTKATAIYANGAHSGAYAELTVTALTKAVAKGAALTGTATAGAGKATGTAKSDAAVKKKLVKVSYTSTCIDNTASADLDVSGCFTTSGAVTPDVGTPTAVKNKYRTLAGFSTAAGSKMTGQATFEKFKKYYTNADYAHRYVTAALAGTGAFKGTTAVPMPDVARVEGAKKGSAYMNVWMYVIREFEDAIKDCKAGCIKCNDDPVHAWDEGVAFYTGTLEGVDGTGSGKMLHALADKRCKNYKTCDANKDSEVNKEIFKLFNSGKVALQGGECTKVAPIRDDIIKWMSVPLVQGALRYAYKVNKLQGGAKEKAEGAVFAAAVLPLVAHCNATAATLIEKNMKIDSTAPMADGFAAVKKAFEDQYSCLGITCAHVGGLVLNDGYYDGFSPCGTSSSTSSGTKAGTKAGTKEGTKAGTASGASGSTGSKVMIVFVAFANLIGLAAYQY